MVRGAVFFDVDGTLAPGSTGQHLAGALGSAGVVREIQAGYGAGLLDSHRAAVLEARCWATWTPAQVRRHLESVPLVDGIAETVRWCHRHDLVPVLATLAWHPVGAYLCERFGFDRACGPRLELAGDRYTGAVAETVRRGRQARLRGRRGRRTRRRTRAVRGGR
ncbi:hypothetical protein GCM10009557_83080 [Virgisporangium ochraceum]|uniref:Haloacid dehalogenase-like hydrolase n=1 Tax=Virgisporangium ochraceum TaxID=65505 RepID=A0A8J3ZY85_9ACTN|nr:haloacid dehalogenase-like hydrolase [Virgisporangium ochraceum]GIJ72499.1 hypothetical protein Voc01_074160 [Virgisporangium ochraceum]